MLSACDTAETLVLDALVNMLTREHHKVLPRRKHYTHTRIMYVASFPSAVPISRSFKRPTQPPRNAHSVTSFVLLRPSSSSNFSNSRDFETPDGRGPEYCPSCMNAKGPKFVKERAIANTDPAVLAEYGNGEWPLKWAWEKGELADNGNYLENDEIAKRHGICGAVFPTMTHTHAGSCPPQP